MNQCKYFTMKNVYLHRRGLAALLLATLLPLAPSTSGQSAPRAPTPPGGKEFPPIVDEDKAPPPIPTRRPRIVPHPPTGVISEEPLAEGNHFGGYISGGGGGMIGGGGGMIAGPQMIADASPSANRKDAIAPLVIQFTNAGPAAVQELEEDLAIMAHLLSQNLERGLGEEKTPSKLGVPLTYTFSGRSVRPVYIEGAGAMFMIKVNMPLFAPPAEKQVKPVETPPPSEWESARQEVLGTSVTMSFSASTASSDIPFDAEQVESLKRTLVATLKNATHIRGLKNDEDVSLAVFGQPVSQTVKVILPQGGNVAFAGPNSQVTVTGPDINVNTRAEDSEALDEHSEPARPERKPRGPQNLFLSFNHNLNLAAGPAAAQKGTVLTMRVKKSVATAFAEGKLTLEEFTQKVSLNTYAGNGYGITSLNSWVQGGRVSGPKVAF